MTDGISFKRHGFPPDVIRYAVWLYYRFTLSIRDVEELLAERGADLSRESVRYWVVKFGPKIAANLKRRRLPPTGRWRLDEMVVRIAGRRLWLWRAVDDEGDVLDMLVQKRRNAKAAKKLLHRLLKNTGVRPECIVTDKLRSYPKAMRENGLSERHKPGGLQENDLAENSHLPSRRRERKQQKFKSQGSAQRFLAAHAAVYNCFNTDTHLVSHPALKVLHAKAHAEWREATKAA